MYVVCLVHRQIGGSTTLYRPHPHILHVLVPGGTLYLYTRCVKNIFVYFPANQVSDRLQVKRYKTILLLVF